MNETDLAKGLRPHCGDPNCNEDRERNMLVVAPNVWCDPCIASIIAALNAGAIQTRASCCGHGRRPGSIALADGRWLIIAADDAERDKIEAIFPVDINGDRRAALDRPTDAEQIAERIVSCHDGRTFTSPADARNNLHSAIAFALIAAHQERDAAIRRAESHEQAHQAPAKSSRRPERKGDRMKGDYREAVSRSR